MMCCAKPLNEQVAIVTGGGRGIGRGICLKLAELGATVIVNYSRSQSAADEVIQQITTAGGKAMAIGFDVASPDQVDEGFKKVMDEFKRIDILVNNAGIAIDSLAMRMKTEDWQKQIEVNLSGPFYCSRAAIKTMIKARYGRIVNISSVIGEMGNAGQSAYASSKAGLIGMTKSLAKELASRGVTVNAVTPGFIATEMTATMTEDNKNKLLEQIPLARLGEVSDLVEAVAFFTLPGAGYMTGQILGVNGGLHM
ncbi:MAG: 3-oxoacyl-[acyl-carrier-protein] reductase [Deltaproteobacteria bacterium]|nr:3-oxoacyl-[acyl-carrier-protein] reductase [Deltaproteobacteria bacterium]